MLMKKLSCEGMGLKKNFARTKDETNCKYEKKLTQTYEGILTDAIIRI